MAPVVAPRSWKSKTTSDAMFTTQFHNRQIERYLEPDIVLTRNEGVVGWGSNLRNSRQMSTAQVVAICFCREMPVSPSDAVYTLLYRLCCHEVLNSIKFRSPGSRS